ncbi:MAG: CinA family protein [Candidatus Omnitrophica bacterium]|nr:CinA family protein [Candidatus Omnitrophota bacterium]
MEPLINHIHSRLIKKAITIAVAESCTGGMLSKTLTDISGSSAYFILGIVAYSNCAKKSILKIPAKIISLKGAVSQEVACRMARGIRKIARTDIGIGVTGIAGPSGGTAAKPAGTVFIAIASQDKTVSKKFRFRGRRTYVRQKAANKALELLKRFI